MGFMMWNLKTGETTMHVTHTRRKGKFKSFKFVCTPEIIQMSDIHSIAKFCEDHNMYLDIDNMSLLSEEGE